SAAAGRDTGLAAVGEPGGGAVRGQGQYYAAVASGRDASAAGMVRSDGGGRPDLTAGAGGWVRLRWVRETRADEVGKLRCRRAKSSSSAPDPRGLRWPTRRTNSSMSG